MSLTEMHHEVEGALNEYHRISTIHQPGSSLEDEGTASESEFRTASSLQQNYCLQIQARQPDGTPLHEWRVSYMFSSKEARTDEYAACRY
jgi:hypothetical protein